MSTGFWDERYAEEALAYGDAPNDFLVEVAGAIPAGGRVLCLAEGQGRNAVWLAQRGHAVLAVDQSAVGLARATDLAAAKGVAIEVRVADLTTWAADAASFDAVVAIFAHLPPAGRAWMHAAAVRALKPGGVFIAEAYTPEQLAFGTGGPQQAALLMTPADYTRELEGLVFERLETRTRPVVEGRYHHGLAAVVQVLARRA